MKINLGCERRTCLRGAQRRLRLPNDTSIAAACHYRETFDRLELFLLISRRVGRDGISSRLLAHRLNYIAAIKGQLIYYNRSVSNRVFTRALEPRRLPCVHTAGPTPHYD